MSEPTTKPMPDPSAPALAQERAAEKAKLLAFAAAVRRLPLPDMETEAGCAVADWIARSLDRFADLVHEKAAELERGS